MIKLEEQKPLLSGKEDIGQEAPAASPIDEKKGDASDEDSKPKKKDDQNIRIRTRDIGIWRVFFQEAPWSFLPGTDSLRRTKELLQALPYVWRFLKEIWAIVPGYLILWVFLRVWQSLEGALSLWVTTQMLQTMQNTILSGKSDMKAVRFALAVKLLLGITQVIHAWLELKCQKVLKYRVAKFCGSHLLEAYTRMDLVTLQRKDIKAKLSNTSETLLGDKIWGDWEQLVAQVTGLLEIGSQGWFLSNFFRTQENGWTLAAVSVLPQVFRGLMYSDDFGGIWFAHAINKAYVRLRSVGDTVVDKSYSEEIISSGLGRYLQQEYHKAIEELGDAPYGHIYNIMWEGRNMLKDIVDIGLADASMVYYLLAVAINPSSFSLTSLTVMRESANSFAWTVYRLFDKDNSLTEKVRFIQDYYGLLETKNEMEDGLTLYPAPDAIESEGMKIEFRNVSMKYPQSESLALNNVSFVIPAGATVILVGANGSGKTTTVSLLSRLLDVTSGEILVDDRAISSFQVHSLRDAQAVLRQKYQHFAFSIRENIGMGDPAWLQGSGEDALESNINARVMHAAALGGADELIDELKGQDKKRADALKKLESKSDPSNQRAPLGISRPPSKLVETELEAESEERSGWDANVIPPATWTGSWQLRGSKLAEMSDEVEKALELSGGQWQRLALARLFMRAERDRVRLVCTDEPSAALDPQAEFDIFQRLRDLNGRKTTKIFITHRFGHLTKHADFILCLKKGELVESGTHEELMKANGEYATLYNIQAQAFQSS